MMEKGFAHLDSYLQSYDSFVVTTHESPDPDGLGAEMAFIELLEKIGKKAVILNADATPEKYQFLDMDSQITILGDGTSLPEDIGTYGLFILDTNDYENTGTVFKKLHDVIPQPFIIDHHSRAESDPDKHYIDGTASSTSEIIYYAFCRCKQDLSYKAALALYTGMLFDTGSFRYPKTSSSTFTAAAAMVEKGVRPTMVFDTLYETYSMSSLVLKSKMLATMEMHFGGRLVLMYLTQEMLLETGGIFSEGEININIPLTVKDVRASVLIKQDIGGPVKVSMRTKGDLDVADVAIKHKGGGHRNAAGYKSYTSLSETRQIVLDDMKQFFE